MCADDEEVESRTGLHLDGGRELMMAIEHKQARIPREHWLHLQQQHRRPAATRLFPRATQHALVVLHSCRVEASLSGQYGTQSRQHGFLGRRASLHVDEAKNFPVLRPPVAVRA